MANVDVAGVLLLVLPVNFGSGESTVRCFGFFVFVIFFFEQLK